MFAEIKIWKLYFDGVVKSHGAGVGIVGIVFITPASGLIPYSFSLLEICSNNVAEYEVLIIGLELALKMLEVLS